MATNRSLPRISLRFRTAACIAAALVFVAGCGGAQRPAAESSADAEQEQQGGRPTLPALEIPSDPLLLLPAECFAGALLDVRALRDSAFYREREREAMAELSPDEKRLLQYFLDQTESAALGLTRDEKGKGKARYQSVLILRGDYELVGILALLADLAGDGRVDGIRSPDPDTGGGGQFLEFYADRKSQGLILDEKTIVISGRKLMPAVLEMVARPDGAARFADSELYRSVGAYAGFGSSVLSLAFSVQSGMADAVKQSSPAPSLFAKFDEAVRNITGVGASISLTDGVQLDAVAVTTSEEYPPRLVELVNALIFAIGLIQQDQAVKGLVDAVNIRAEGKLARASLHATEQQLIAFMEKMTARMQEGEDAGARAPAPGQPAVQPPDQPSGKAPGKKAKGKSKAK